MELVHAVAILLSFGGHAGADSTRVIWLTEINRHLRGLLSMQDCTKCRSLLVD
jgi:hypothetical protein